MSQSRNITPKLEKLPEIWPNRSGPQISTLLLALLLAIVANGELTEVRANE